MKDFFSDMSKLQAEQKPGKGNPKFVPITSNQSYRISPMDFVFHDKLFTSYFLNNLSLKTLAAFQN